MADEIRGLTEEDANAILLAISKGGKKAREFLNFALNWPKGEDTRGVMAEGQPDKRGRQGLGDVLWGKAPENFESYAYGMGGPWGVGEGQVIPHMKPGRAGEGLDMLSMLPVGTAIDAATAGKTGITATVPFIAGQIRKKGDIITPEVAQELARRLLMDPESGRIPLEGNDVILDKVARYLQASAGTENDPLKKVPFWQKAKRGFYPDAERRGVPLLPPDTATGKTPSAVELRFERPELELPSETYQAAGVDDLIGKALETGKEPTQDLRRLGVADNLSEEDLVKMDAISRAINGSPLDRARINERTNEVKNTLSLGSGIYEDKISDVVKALPEGAIIASKGFGNDSRRQLEVQLRTLYGSNAFKNYIESIPADKLQKMKFDEIASGFAKHNQGAFEAWARTARGPVLRDAYTSPTAEWQTLDNDDALLAQGVRSDICVGQEDPYCKSVRDGTMKVFGLRDKETQKPLLTVNTYVETGDPDMTGLFDPTEAARGLEGLRAALGGEDIKPIAERISALYEKITGEQDYAKTIKRQLLTGEFRHMPEYLQVVHQAGYRINPERIEAIKALQKELGGAPLPDTFGTAQTYQRLDQIKGKGNAVENIPPELMKEAREFVTDLEAQGVKTDTSGDWKRIKGILENEREPTSPSGLTESQLERIMNLYEPRGQYGTKQFGRNWLIDPEGGGAYTLDRGTTMRAPLDTFSDPPKIDLWNLDASDEASKIRTELGRAIKGATEPGANVKLEIEALKRVKEEQRLENERLVGEWLSWSKPGTSRKYLRKGDQVIWEDSYGDVFIGDLDADGRTISSSSWLSDAVRNQDMARALTARIRGLKTGRMEVPPWQAPAVAPNPRRAQLHPNFENENYADVDLDELHDYLGGDVVQQAQTPGGQMINYIDMGELDGRAYFMEGDMIESAPMFRDGRISWDDVQLVADLDNPPPRNILRAISARLQEANNAE